MNLPLMLSLPPSPSSLSSDPPPLVFFPLTNSLMIGSFNKSLLSSITEEQEQLLLDYVLAIQLLFVHFLVINIFGVK
jgi:hypothetical protein